MMGVGGVAKDSFFFSSNGLKVGGLIVDGLGPPFGPKTSLSVGKGKGLLRPLIGEGRRDGGFLPLGPDLWLFLEKIMEIGTDLCASPMVVMEMRSKPLTEDAMVEEALWFQGMPPCF